MAWEIARFYPVSAFKEEPNFYVRGIIGGVSPFFKACGGKITRL